MIQISIKQMKEMKIGESIVLCSESDICCLIHPAYMCKKPPRTKKGIKEGCTCWMAWGAVCAKNKLSKKDFKDEKRLG